ncbi:dienelactone hydrolase family protein [Desulfopila aestuarii]|uniref:Dienelactone hydrolase n=1 Tax=Desulfopila aestuarii DSM 18488 TaxID=1121416 RepID=A0A1M7Y8X9_9BACT|nr:dienelactone hydrolase family protein [Desulfopila aestuarii]SHO49077.1 Dienelactone hydrolase [Desulfopila aestuarii DSM 18488]
MRLLLLLLLLIPNVASGAGVSVQYQVGGKPYEGYYVSPGPDAPFLLLVHDWDGLTEYEIQRAGMLAKLGYAVFAADLFGAGIRPTKVEDKRKLTGELYADRDKMRNLMNGAITAARNLGARIDNGAAFGYCFGGAAVLELARSGAGLKGFVSFHGGLATPEGQGYDQTKGSVLVLHGTADASVSMEQFASLATQLETAQIPHEMITYSGAPHAFTVFGSPSYREDADKKSWQRFVGFLQETFK